MDEFLNFPGRFTIHCDEVKGIRPSALGVIFSLRRSGDYLLEGIFYPQVEAELKRARAAKADARPCQAVETEAIDDAFKSMNDAFRNMDNVFKNMDGMYRSVRRVVGVSTRKEENADRKG